jgi:hypothetical protein
MGGILSFRNITTLADTLKRNLLLQFQLRTADFYFAHHLELGTNEPQCRRPA